MKSITENINLSLLEIFAVLLPGGALILLCWQNQDLQHELSAMIPDPKNEWQWSLSFLGLSYAIGYVLFYLGSLLDDLLYDRCRFLFYKPRELELRHLGIKKMKLFARLFAMLKWNKHWKDPNIQELIKGKNTLFKAALACKNREMESPGADAINLYKWSVAKLMVSYTNMYGEVERHQAASKFFRSILVVSGFSAVLTLLELIAIPIGWSICCLLISLLIYLQQRFKAIQTAYEYIVVVENLKVNKPENGKKS